MIPTLANYDIMVFYLSCSADLMVSNPNDCLYLKVCTPIHEEYNKDHTANLKQFSIYI